MAVLTAVLSMAQKLEHFQDRKLPVFQVAKRQNVLLAPKHGVPCQEEDTECPADAGTAHLCP